MKTHLIRLLTIVIAGLALGFSSCDDDAPPSKVGILVNKSWLVASYEIDGDDALEDCMTDNTLIFFSDGTYSDEIGAIKCEEDESDSEGTWKFKANETILSIIPAGDLESDWKILELTENKLRMSQFVTLLDAEVVVVMEAN